MKIVVYAISKNEEQFVDRWYKSMKEADEIYVLDTGSTDNTVAKLKKHNINVLVKEIKPWRFDVARNESLNMLPNDVDICVCTDLDEVFEKGWRKELEKLWNKNTTRMRYNYNWKLDKNNKPVVNFYIEKIHSRHDYKWTHPVHEILTYIGNQVEIFQTTNNITLNHFPDDRKSRSSYLSLLELSVKESPNDDRNMHYLGREYMFNGRWQEAIDILINHLSLPTATWKDERSASMRFIARCYTQLARYDEARMWIDKAIIETPYLRDPYIERALIEYKLENWLKVEKYCLLALQIKSHTKTYINEPFSWNETVYDLLSLAAYHQGKIDDALDYIDMAIAINNDDERLKKNKTIFIENKLNKS